MLKGDWTLYTNIFDKPHAKGWSNPLPCMNPTVQPHGPLHLISPAWQLQHEDRQPDYSHHLNCGCVCNVSEKYIHWTLRSLVNQSLIQWVHLYNIEWPLLRRWPNKNNFHHVWMILVGLIYPGIDLREKSWSNCHFQLNECKGWGKF